VVGVMLTCARCGKSFEPDVNHVQIDGQTKRMDDCDVAEIFYMHEECWIRETEDWEVPA
jgi:phage terminase large subunit GpA-like protein